MQDQLRFDLKPIQLFFQLQKFPKFHHNKGLELLQQRRLLLPETIEGLMAKENIDGALVGGASLEADSFLALLEMYK